MNKIILAPEKKYVLMEVAEENGCNLEDLKYDGIYCSLTDEICPMSEDKPCPHGKTLSEMAETANREILNEMTGGKADSVPSHLSFTKRLHTGLKALLSGSKNEQL